MLFIGLIFVFVHELFHSLDFPPSRVPDVVFADLFKAVNKEMHQFWMRKIAWPRVHVAIEVISTRFIVDVGSVNLKNIWLDRFADLTIPA